MKHTLGITGLAWVVVGVLAAGTAHGQDGSGSIVAWGWNAGGQCDVPAPNVGFVGVAAGWFHSLGLRADGSIAAWGYNASGQCNVPAPNSNFIGVEAGTQHSLGLKGDGSIVAWGANWAGQCNVPQPNTGFVAVAGGEGHSLGLRGAGSIVAWGENWAGQCNVPQPNTGFVAVAAGGYHSLGLRADGSFVAWGRYHEGQCFVPEPNTGFVGVAAGDFHSLGLKADGSIVAWGSNYDDYGEYAGQCDVPAPNTGLVAVAAGWFHSLGLRADGTIVAWGWNDGGECNVPSPNTGFAAIAGGGHHSLGLKQRGWSTLAYLSGDNSLDDESLADFNEMELQAWKQDIIVCWDRLGWGNSAYYKVRWNPDPNVLATYIDDLDRWPQGELDMGDPNTLTNFTQWAIDRYPAQHYLLVIWNHGGGWGPRGGARGVSWDDTNGSSFLTTNQVRDAIAAVSNQIGAAVDVLGFDACLMQMAEVAYSVREHCTTVVGSEETEPGAGWDYDALLSSIDPNSTPEDVCTAIVTSYGAQGFPTQSAFRTQGLAELAQRVDELAGALISNMPAERANIWRARRDLNLVTFDYDGAGPSPDNANSYVDLGQLCQLLAANCQTQAVQDAAGAVRSALVSARIANATNGSYYAPAEGLSIYFPDHYPDMVGQEDFYANYQNTAGSVGANANLDFVADTRWDEFLRMLLEVGDVNCDGLVSFADINPFVLALSGPENYYAEYPNCRHENADCNDDGLVNFADINPFVALLAGG